MDNPTNWTPLDLGSPEPLAIHVMIFPADLPHFPILGFSHLGNHNFLTSNMFIQMNQNGDLTIKSGE
jgi:hypothetical protein